MLVPDITGIDGNTVHSWGIAIGSFVTGGVVGVLLQGQISEMDGPRSDGRSEESTSPPAASQPQEPGSRLHSVTALLRQCQREKESWKHRSQNCNHDPTAEFAEDPRLEEDPFEVALADFQASQFDATVENDAEWNGLMTQSLEDVASRLNDKGSVTEVSCRAYQCVTRLSAALSPSDRRQFLREVAKVLPDYTSKQDEQGELVVIFGAANDEQGDDSH